MSFQERRLYPSFQHACKIPKQSMSKLNQAIKKGTIHYGVLYGNKKTSNTDPGYNIDKL